MYAFNDAYDVFLSVSVVEDRYVATRLAERLRDHDRRRRFDDYYDELERQLEEARRRRPPFPMVGDYSTTMSPPCLPILCTPVIRRVQHRATV